MTRTSTPVARIRSLSKAQIKDKGTLQLQEKTPQKANHPIKIQVTSNRTQVKANKIPKTWVQCVNLRIQAKSRHNQNKTQLGLICQ